MNLDFRGDDPAGAPAILRRVYRGDRIRWRHGASAALAVAGTELDGICVYEVLHAAPFECAIADAHGHTVVVGTQGEGLFRGERERFRCAPGYGGMVPADRECTISADRMLGYFLLHIDPRALAERCAGWIGDGDERPLAFEHAGFSEELCLHLGQAIAAIHRVARMQWCPAAATQALVGHALDLLLTMHPHDRSAQWRQNPRFAKRRVREARWLIDNASGPLTVGALAAQMRSPVAPLVMAFRQHQPEPPLEALLWATWRRERNASADRADETAAGALADAVAPNEGGSMGRRGQGGDVRRLTARQIVGINEFIAQRLSEKLSMAALAQCAGIARRDFLLRFRNTFGITPLQYLIRERLDEVKRLLEHSRYGIADIAAQTGFSSHSHLSSQFLRNVGVTPKDYRRSRRAAAEDGEVSPNDGNRQAPGADPPAARYGIMR